MKTWEVTLSAGDIAAVPSNAYSTGGGFSGMGQYAASLDGSVLAAAHGIRIPGVVAIHLTNAPTARLYREAWLTTDQYPLVRMADQDADFVSLDTLQEYVTSSDYGSDARFRTASQALVRGANSSNDEFQLDMFSPNNGNPRWTNKDRGELYGLAISPDGQFVAVSAGNAGVIRRLAIFDGDTGTSLWSVDVELSRATLFGSDPLYFSNDNTRILLRTASEIQIRSSSAGKLEKRIEVGATVHAGFDERLHSGFDGRYLWLFQYRTPRDTSDAYPGRRMGPVGVCGYAVFDVQNNRSVRSETAAKNIDELLIGKHTGGAFCNVRSVLPLSDGGVLIVEYVSVDTLRIHRSTSIPGTP